MVRSLSGDGEENFFPECHDVTLIEIVVSIIIVFLYNDINEQSGTTHLYTSIGNIWILILFVYRFISETYSE